jgi:hypothetical protein
MLAVRRVVTLLTLLVATLPASAADRGRARQVISEAIQIEQARMVELSRVAESDAHIAKDLFEHVKYREEAARALDNKANDFRAAASTVDGRDREALLQFANEFAVFANHDRDFAVQRRQAADILERQAADARGAVNEHRAHIAKLQQRLAQMN